MSLQDAIDQLQPYFPFPLDTWQIEAGKHIMDGKNVIVCAPTGAGKTVVGEMALRHVFRKGLQAIYTTPLKALSNQKFVELRKLFGPTNVGLSTGDMSINRRAPIMVMTTEVYRNMAWRDNTSDESAMSNSPAEDRRMMQTLESLQAKNIKAVESSSSRLINNGVVILDEFHYMGQKGRGGVWEESVIISPSHTQIVGLSATLPNANRLAAWIESVTGRPTELVQCTGKRPVPLRYLYATSDGLHPLFRDPDAGPGAPKGLLGLRGDGAATNDDSDKKGKKKKGFSEKEEMKDSEKTGFPRGLQIHPDLRRRTDQVMNRVERLLKKQELRNNEEQNNGLGGRNRYVSDWDSKEPQRSRKASQLRKLSPRDEKRQRERLLRREMGRAVPKLPVLLRRLQLKNLLPAIFFIFSRAG